MEDDLHALIYAGFYDRCRRRRRPFLISGSIDTRSAAFQAADCTTLCAKCLVLIYSCCGGEGGGGGGSVRGERK